MFIRITAVFCLLTILLGSVYTEPGYDWIRHSISELAGQNTGNAWVMRLGLLGLGLGAAWGYLTRRSKYNIFFLVFGVFIVLAALFPHRPFVEGRAYSALIDDVHSVCSTIAGMSAVGGFLLLAIRATSTGRKLMYAALAAAYTILPLGMVVVPSVHGLLQRLIFGSFIAWSLLDHGHPDAG